LENTQIQNFLKVLSAGAEFFHVFVQTDLTELIVALAIMRTLLKMEILLKGFLILYVRIANSQR